MKIGLPKYQDLDFDREVWKTLSAIKIIQTAYNKTKVSEKFLTSILLLDIGQTFEKPQLLTTEKIKTFQNTINNHIEILKENNLIEGDAEFTIPSEHVNLLSFLTNHMYLNIHLPLDSFQFYGRLIPQSASAKGAYTNYDDSFTSLHRGMYIPKGIFIKTWIEDKIYSGIMETIDNFDDVYRYLQTIRKDLQNIGINIDVLEPIPIKPIPLFPLFTEANALKRIIEKKEDAELQPIKDRKEFLQKWYQDYVNGRHEIIKQIPRIWLADAYWNKPKHYVVMTNSKFDSILTAQYISEDKDRVEVRIMDKIPMMEKLHDEVKDLPNKQNLLRTSISWSKDILSTLKPPFYAALKNIAGTIKEFNKIARCPLFDANDITDEEIENWIKAEINAKRYLINKLHVKNEYEQRWLSPIFISVEYSLDEPKPSWRTSGNLFIKYISSDVDKIEIRKIEKDEYKKMKLEEFKDSDKKILMMSTGDLLHHMMKTRGEYSTVHL